MYTRITRRSCWSTDPDSADPGCSQRAHISSRPLGDAAAAAATGLPLMSHVLQHTNPVLFLCDIQKQERTHERPSFSYFWAILECPPWRNGGPETGSTYPVRARAGFTTPAPDFDSHTKNSLTPTTCDWCKKKTKGMAYPSHLADTGSQIDSFAGMVLAWIRNSRPITSEMGFDVYIPIQIKLAQQPTGLFFFCLFFAINAQFSPYKKQEILEPSVSFCWPF